MFGWSSVAGAEESTGKVRLCHLSPATPAVDMYFFDSVSNPSAPPLVRGAGYGAITPYLVLPAGRYVVAVRSAGATANSSPALTTGIDIVGGSVQSLLVFGNGPSGATRGQVLADDLTPVSADSGVVRIVQGADVAVQVQVQVQVQAAGGLRLATDMRYGTATEYATAGRPLEPRDQRRRA